MVFAASLGIGSETRAMIAPIALNRGGAAVTLSTRLAGDEPPGAQLARLARRRQEEGASPLTLAVVYPFSIHNYLLRTWLVRLGVDPDRDVRLTVAPPSRTADLLAEGVIEGFCAGAPWNAVAEAAGVGRTVVHVEEVLPDAPDKVLGVTEYWAAANPQILAGLVRALEAAGRWCAGLENRQALTDLLARPEHVGAPPQAIADSLDQIVFAGAGLARPRPDHALWILDQLARWGQGEAADAAKAAGRIYRPDLYDQALSAG